MLPQLNSCLFVDGGGDQQFDRPLEQRGWRARIALVHALGRVFGGIGDLVDVGAVDAVQAHVLGRLVRLDHDGESVQHLLREEV